MTSTTETAEYQNECTCPDNQDSSTPPHGDMNAWKGKIHTCHPETRIRNDWAAIMCPYCGVPICGYPMDPSQKQVKPVCCPHLIGYRDTDGNIYNSNQTERSETSIVDIARHLPDPICFTDGSLAIEQSEWAVLYHKERTNTDITAFG